MIRSLALPSGENNTSGWQVTLSKVLKVMLNCVELVCVLLCIVFFPFLHYVIRGCLYDEIKFYTLSMGRNMQRYLLAQLSKNAQ